MVQQLFSLQGDRARKLVDTLRQIHANFDLPQIAVIGDTSSGKSSVLSAVSGFEFPSDDKLCTRCPIQMCLTNSSTFQCKIQVISEETPFQEAVDTMEDLPDVLAKAIGTVVGDSTQRISETNVIVTAEGPDLPSVTIIDLPGLIRTVGSDEDPSIIDVVRNMLLSFVRKSRTVILAVVSANVDIHNQEVMKLALDADPDGVRTLAVLTKPDLIEDGTENTVRDLACNKGSHKVKLGWAVVRCRDKKMRNENVSLNMFSKMETQYFNGTSIWRDVKSENGRPTPTIGSSNLRVLLCKLLTTRIECELPDVIKEIQCTLDSDLKALSLLGDALDGPSIRRKTFEKYVRDVTLMINEAATTSSCTEFFKLKNMKNENRWSVYFAEALKEMSSSILSSAAELKMPPCVDIEKQSYVSIEGVENPKDYRPMKLDRLGRFYDDKDKKWFQLTWIHSLNEIMKQMGHRLPGFYDYKSFCLIFGEFAAENWENLALTFSKDIQIRGEEVIQRVVQYVVVNPRASIYFLGRLKELQHDAWELTNNSIRAAYKRELYPTTQNHYFHETELENLKRAHNRAIRELELEQRQREADLEALLRNESRVQRESEKQYLRKSQELHMFSNNAHGINVRLKEIERTARREKVGIERRLHTIKDTLNIDTL